MFQKFPARSKEFDLKKVLPGYSRSHKHVTFVSPGVKRQLAHNIVSSALKCLGGVVGGVAKQGQSFNKDDYIRKFG